MNKFAAALAVLLIPLAFACSDDVTAPSTNRITIDPSTTSATIDAGESSTINVTISRPVGYDGPITLTVGNMPNGVTGTFTPATLDASEDQSTLILSADPNAPDGVGEVMITASGTNVEPQSATISVSVGDATANPGSFAISVVPGAITLTKGGSGSAIIAIDRSGGYAGAVSLGIDGFSGGISATVSPGSTSGNTATVNISADNTVAGGTYTATITAAGDGVPTQATSLSVTIMPAVRQ